MTRNATPVPFSADLDELPVPVRAIIGASQYLWSNDNNNNTNNNGTTCLVYWSCQLSRKGANQSSCIVACCTAGSGPEGSKPILVLYLRKMQNTWKISGLAIPLQKKTVKKRRSSQSQLFIALDFSRHTLDIKQCWTAKGTRSPTYCSCPLQNRESCPAPMPIAQCQLRKPMHRLIWPCTWAKGWAPSFSDRFEPTASFKQLSSALL